MNSALYIPYTYLTFVFDSLQLIKNIGITRGKDSSIGYYVGLMVGIPRARLAFSL